MFSIIMTIINTGSYTICIESYTICIESGSPQGKQFSLIVQCLTLVHHAYS